MSKNIEKIVKELSELSVLDVVNLVDELKKDWKISDSSLSSSSAPSAAPSAAPVAEKISFDVSLESAGENKMGVIKEVKTLLNLGLKEAKDLVDAAPKVIKEGASKAEAEEMKTKLEAAGAKVVLK